MTRFTPSFRSSFSTRLSRASAQSLIAGSFFLAAAALPLLTSTLSSAQITTTNGGSIQGTITDASGAAIPNAQVSILGTDTGYKKVVKTDGAGYYVVGPLTPGQY